MKIFIKYNSFAHWSRVRYGGRGRVYLSTGSDDLEIEI